MFEHSQLSSHSQFPESQAAELEKTNLEQAALDVALLLCSAVLCCALWKQKALVAEKARSEDLHERRRSFWITHPLSWKSQGLLEPG